MFSRDEIRGSLVLWAVLGAFAALAARFEVTLMWFLVGAVAGAVGQFCVFFIARGWPSDHGGPPAFRIECLVIAGVMVMVGPAQAQELTTVETGSTSVQPHGAYTVVPTGLPIGERFEVPLVYEVGFSPMAESPVIIGALCVGAGIGFGGWVIIEAWKRCLSLQRRRLTNAVDDLMLAPASPAGAAEGSTVGEEDSQAAGSDPAPASDECGCPGPTLVPGEPGPVSVEVFEDGVWVAVAPSVPGGSRFLVREGSMVRGRVLPLHIDRDGLLTAPPGVVETSDDLVHWRTFGRFDEATSLRVVPGFYRMKW